MGKRMRIKSGNESESERLERQIRVHERRVIAYEDQMLRRALQPIGEPALGAELGWPHVPVSSFEFNRHGSIQSFYPLVLEACFCGRSNPPPVPCEKPLPSLGKMVYEFPDTYFHKECVLAARYDRKNRPHGFGVIFPYNGNGSLILHDRPDLAEGPPLVSRLLRNGCVVQIHWFEPFIDDVADLCRADFAREGSVLEDRIEANYPFREAHWSDWIDLDPPIGW